MVKKELPNFTIILVKCNPEIHTHIITLFKENGISIYRSSFNYNPDFPHVCWDTRELINCTIKYEAKLCVKTKEEFLSYFFTPDIIEVW